MKKLLVLFSCFSTLALLASDGSLDTAGFGAPNGFVTLAGGGEAIATAVQTDGKIVVVGSAAGNIGRTVRYDTAGNLDPSFNGTGIVTEANFFPQDVIIQADGKIVVVGTDSTLFSSFILVRYDANGILDPSFGTGGIVIEAGLGFATAVVLQPDSKIIAMGISGALSQIVRFTPSGVIDTVFQQTTAISQVADGVLLEDGKLLVATQNSSSEAILIRYNTTGTIDTSYGVSGIATVTAPTSIRTAGLVLQTDGKAVIDFTGNIPPFSIVLARFDSTGSLDAGYGTAGVFVSSPGSFDAPHSLVLQADNKSIFVGRNAALTDFLVGRVTTGGATDASWGVAGFTTLPAGFGNAAGIQADGYVIGVGRTVTNSWITARYINSVAMQTTTLAEPIDNAQIASPVTFSGLAQNPSIVYVLVDGIIAGGTQTIGTGNTWSLTLSIPPGAHTAQAVSIYQNHKLDIASEIINFTVVLNPELTASKSDNRQGAPVTVGDTINYTITITNTGSSTAENIVLSDILPNCVSFLSASVSNGAVITEANGQVTSSLGSIAAGETVTITITVRVGVTFAPFLTNRAFITGSNISEIALSAQTPVVPVLVSCVTQAIINKYCPCL